jgi:type I restriction enzyme M protein
MQPTRTINGAVEGGGRIAIVLNGSPLFTGGAGSGESDIRKWVIENDLLEAIVALPTDMFYNTGISTYVWILCNHKPTQRKGKVQLISGVEFFQKMRKSLGSKRKELRDADIEKITKLYGEFVEAENSKIFANRDFGYSTITVERPLKLSFQVPEPIEPSDDPLQVSRRPLFPAINEALREQYGSKKWMSRKQFLEDAARATKSKGIEVTSQHWKALVAELGERDEEAEICRDSKERPEADPTLRDTENVPLKEDIHGYFQREVLPHVPDAWVDESKTKVGYEIPFTRHFYKFVSPRSLDEIDADLKLVTGEILALLSEVTH